MGQVTMDLTELDKIREDLKTANLEIGKRNQTIKEKDEEIVKVKADKRTVKTVITHSLVDQSDYIFSIKSQDYPNRDWHLVEELTRDLCRNFRLDNYGSQSEHTRKVVSTRISEFVKKLGTSKSSSNLTKMTETTEFINFDDVISQIRTETESKIAKDLGKLRADVVNLTDKLSEANSNKATEISKLTDKHNIEVLAVKEDLGKAFNSLRKMYEDLLANRETKSLEQQIFDLRAELEEEKARKWYQNRKKK